MTFHYLVSWLAVLVVPLAVGIGAFVCALRGKVPMWASLGVAFVGTCLTFVLTVSLSWRCTESYDVILAARTLLTPEERGTLRGSEFLCPVIYTFERDDERTCLVPDGDGGAFVGCG